MTTKKSLLESGLDSSLEVVCVFKLFAMLASLMPLLILHGSLLCNLLFFDFV